MTLFCVRDGDSTNDDLVWNQPLKKVEKSDHIAKPVDRYEKTATPGVVIDHSTGKMETQIPENDGMSKPLGNPLYEYWSIPRQQGKSRLKELVTEYTKLMQAKCGIKMALKGRPGVHDSIIMDDLVDPPKTDLQEYMQFLNSKEVNSFLKKRNGRYIY